MIGSKERTVNSPAQIFKMNMGNIIQAICDCGLESDTIFQGIGFRYYENHVRVEPAYCDACGIVIGRDKSKSYSKCPRCRKKVKFYEDDTDASSDENEWDMTTDYSAGKESWHCPRCKRDTLRFESMGLWD